MTTLGLRPAQQDASPRERRYPPSVYQAASISGDHLLGIDCTADACPHLPGNLIARASRGAAPNGYAS